MPAIPLLGGLRDPAASPLRDLSDDAMTKPSGTTLISSALAVVGIAVIVLWLNVGPNRDLQARIPGLDRPAGEPSGDAKGIPAAAVLVRAKASRLNFLASGPAFAARTWMV